MAAFDDEVDDFDFGGDEAEEDKPLEGNKRRFEELLEDDDEEELYPAKKPTVSGEDHATTTILNLRSSLEEKDAAIAALQAKLTATNAELERWRDAIRGASLLPPDTKPEPAPVMEEIMKLVANDGRVKEQLRAAKRRENVMLLRLAGTEQEITELKTHIEDMREMLKPPMLQARRLMLDPVIHAEFTHLKKQLQEAEKKARTLQDDLAAVQFTPHSKHGKMLMAKCRTLQEENEEIGLQASEGKIHELENKLALQKQLNAELNQAYSELKEYVDDMTQEEEKLQARIYSLQRQLNQRDKELNQQLAAREHRRQARLAEKEREMKSKREKIEPPKVVEEMVPVEETLALPAAAMEDVKEAQLV